MDGVSLAERTDSRYLTTAEVAAELVVSTKTVIRLIEAGELPAVRVGPRLFRVKPEALADFIAERETGP